MRTLVDAAILEHSKVSSWKRRVLHHEEMHANPQNFQKWLFSDWLLVHAAVYGICCCQWTFDFVYFEQLRYGCNPPPPVLFLLWQYGKALVEMKQFHCSSIRCQTFSRNYLKSRLNTIWAWTTLKQKWILGQSFENCPTSVIKLDIVFIYLF